MNATDPVTATLEAQQWNVVLAGLGELKWKDANVVIQKLMPQLDAAVEAAAAAGKPNGAGELEARPAAA